MLWTLALERLTVKAKAVRSEERRVGKECRLRRSSVECTKKVSSFGIVPVRTGFASVSLVAADRVTVKVSSGSNAVSAHTSTLTGLLVFFFKKVTVYELLA